MDSTYPSPFLAIVSSHLSFCVYLNSFRNGLSAPSIDHRSSLECSYENLKLELGQKKRQQIRNNFFYKLVAQFLLLSHFHENEHAVDTDNSFGEHTLKKKTF